MLTFVKFAVNPVVRGLFLLPPPSSCYLFTVIVGAAYVVVVFVPGFFRRFVSEDRSWQTDPVLVESCPRKGGCGLPTMENDSIYFNWY